MPNASHDAGQAATQDAAPQALPDLDSLLPLLGQAVTTPEGRERLKQSREFQGFVGQLAHERLTAMKAADDDEKSKQAAEKAQQDMLELARTDPEKFAEKYLGEYEVKKSTTQIQELENTVVQKFGKVLGERISAIPEFSLLSQDDLNWIASQSAGASPNEVLSNYTAALVQKVANAKALKELEEWKAKELPKEVEARRKELAAKERAARPAPTTHTGSPASSSREPDFRRDPAAWDAWYEANHPGARPTVRRS